jgi:hypothetical protein
MKRRSSQELPPIDRIRLFVKRQADLSNTRLGKSGFTITLRITGEIDTGGAIAPSLPDEDDLRSYLLTFRKFFVEAEPIFLPSILNLAERYLASEKHRDALRKARAGFVGIRDEGLISLSCTGESLSPEEVADLWINGHYFHDDAAKASRLAELRQPYDPLIRFHFLMFVTTASDVLLFVARILDDALKKNLFSEQPGQSLESRA